MTRLVALILLAPACKRAPETTPGTTPTGGTVDYQFPLPTDVDTIDFTAAFTDAVDLIVEVTTIAPWRGHAASLDVRQPGCPDFWTGPFTEGDVVVGSEEGVSWRDDCLVEDGSELVYDGWVWWDFDVEESGDPTTYDGHVIEASRVLDGDGFVSDVDGTRFEFKGTANDSLYQVEAYGYERVVYSSTVDATVTGRDVFDPTSLTPRGYRTDLFHFLTGGDVDVWEARGDVYLFEPRIQGRFDSVGVDLHLQGVQGAAPDLCTLEPLGWLGLRDPDAIWYEVVFQPRFEDDIVGEPYANDPLSGCDGCGWLYVQGIAMEEQVCVDLSFVFDDGAFPLPDPDDYVLPIHAL